MGLDEGLVVAHSFNISKRLGEYNSRSDQLTNFCWQRARRRFFGLRRLWKFTRVRDQRVNFSHQSNGSDFSNLGAIGRNVL